jgi:hypothetical protein
VEKLKALRENLIAQPPKEGPPKQES